MVDPISETKLGKIKNKRAICLEVFKLTISTNLLMIEKSKIADKPTKIRVPSAIIE